MKKHPTSNIQPRTTDDSARRHLWMLDVIKLRLVCAALVLLASATFAFAQSNVPGPADFDRFSHFVADRNIFDPNRVPHSYRPGSIRPPRPPRSRGTPGIMLVGTMSYEKGMFAFFNGNSEEWKKALSVAGKIADYTVTEITASRVQLESADKKQQLELRVGDGLRQENGKWVLSAAGDLPAENSSTGTASSTSSSGGESSTPAAPASANEGNDVLKRLMQLREKENQ